jgi:hypothetical protein
MYDIYLKDISFVEVVIRHLTSLTSIHHRELARPKTPTFLRPKREPRLLPEGMLQCASNSSDVN